MRWQWLRLLESTQPRDLKQLLACALISAWTLPQRHHMRLVADKPLQNKLKCRLILNKESAREWAELKASSTSTALQLEVFVNKVLENGGKQRVITKRALPSTEEQNAQEVWMSFTEASTLEDPARAGGDAAREHG